jgi:hypothetical protein
MGAPDLWHSKWLEPDGGAWRLLVAAGLADSRLEDCAVDDGKGLEFRIYKYDNEDNSS